jgi:protein-tyrosine phosphatase
VINTVLFVCIGNICRSPMAERLFSRALPALQVCSAGIHAVVGAPADPIAVALMREQGIDLTAHRAQNLSGWMVKEADLIVTMDQEQARIIANAHPASKGKLIRLGEAGRYDVPDPYLHGEAAFRHACGLITWGINELAGRIATLEASEAVPRHDTYPQIPAPKALGFYRPSVSM